MQGVQLDAAAACSADWLKQYPNASLHWRQDLVFLDGPTTVVGAMLQSSASTSASASSASIFICVAAVVGILFAIYQYKQVASVEITKPEQKEGADQQFMSAITDKNYEDLGNIYTLVKQGAEAFLLAEYTLCFIFIAVFGLLVLFLTAYVNTSSGHFVNPRAVSYVDDMSLISQGAIDSQTMDWTVGVVTAISFAVGGLTSILSGYVGMMVAVFANARCAIQASKANDSDAWKSCFNTAFQAGSVMGFALCGLALGMLFILINIFAHVFPLDYDVHDAGSYDDNGNTLTITTLMECIAGYGLGGSCIALFGRVGGGIYTKAADVGADLAGKVVHDLPEDDPKNPATIADNVGDNVGDVAGMGSDLFGSFAEATCAALVISTQYPTMDFLLSHNLAWCGCALKDYSGAAAAKGAVTCAAYYPTLIEAGFAALMFPLLISAVSIFVCMLSSFIATHISPVQKEEDVEKVLKVQLAVTCVAMTLVMIPMCMSFLPEQFVIQGVESAVSRWDAFLCVAVGLFGGCIIGFVTEYYTSHSYSPVRDVAYSCETGAATNIIYGLALGYKSCIIPIVIISLNVYIAFHWAGMYGVALSALGFLGTLSTCLSIDVYGPVCDNAGGLAEMSEFPEETRNRTDALDAAGNTTAAIGKGFAIGSAALVSLALFGGFQARVSTHLDQTPHFSQAVTITIDILQPVTFAFLFIGAMLPYAFTAFTMKSVGVAANMMVKEVEVQFNTIKDDAGRGLLDKNCTVGPDYNKCIKISTDASLREMILPGLLVILSPIVTGVFFGVEAVCGLLVGGLTSGVQLAISQSNAGGAWDNAKKFVEKGHVVLTREPFTTEEENLAAKVTFEKASESYYSKVEPSAFEDRPMTPEGERWFQGENPHEKKFWKHGKTSEVHKSAVVGDTVGDPLKDTSGPALNILMKLMAIISLVFADFFCGIRNGQGLFGTSREVTSMK